MFERLTVRTGLKRAALLVQDTTHDSYVPIASVGFDVTTQRRLRIPAQLLNHNPDLIAGAPLELEPQAISMLSPFFSTREFSLITTLRFTPLLNRGSVFSLLIETHHEGDELADISQIADLLRAESAHCYDRYVARLALFPPFPASRYEEQPLESIQQEIEECNRTATGLLCMHFRLNSLLQTIAPPSVTLDPLRFREDLIRVVYSFVYEIGSLVPVGPDGFLLCIRSRHHLKPGFVVDHIASTLRDFYHNITGVSSAMLASLRYPEDASNASDLLEQLGIPTSDVDH